MFFILNLRFVIHLMSHSPPFVYINRNKLLSAFIASETVVQLLSENHKKMEGSRSLCVLLFIVVLMFVH